LPWSESGPPLEGPFAAPPAPVLPDALAVLPEPVLDPLVVPLDVPEAPPVPDALDVPLLVVLPLPAPVSRRHVPAMQTPVPPPALWHRLPSAREMLVQTPVLGSQVP
jgi:hypothetical protein